MNPAPVPHVLSRGRTYCSVNGCFNTSDVKPDISYFKHPSDVTRRLQWLRLIGREELVNKPERSYAVCEDHFRVQDILLGTKRKTLKKNALPAYHLPYREPDIETPVKVEKCEDPLNVFEEPLPEATRKRKLPSPSPGCSNNKELETQNSNLVYVGQDTFLRLCSKFLTKELAEIVRAQTHLKNLAGKKGLDFNQISLNLYHNNPQGYRMLYGALRLPRPLSVHKNAIPLTSELKGNFMSLFTSKVDSMTDLEKNCSAVISSISVKPNLFYCIDHDTIVGFLDINGVRLPDTAEKAYVMMVRGIYSKWQQPVGYALLSRGEKSVEFNEWIDGLLEQLFKIGLNVRTFVSNTGNEFINAAKNRCVTIEKPYFFINNRKIFYIFDAPYLIKSVRNYFIQHNFLFQDRRAKYEHVRSFYAKDKTRDFKLAPKLTKNHINPTNFEKNELRYATQLLSNTVATGISTYAEFYIIDKSGKDTADFIQLMNNLFDCLNSSDCKDPDDYKSAFRGIKSQTDFFYEMLIFFRDIKLSDVKFEPKFIEGFQITIRSILQLFDDIRAEGYTFLPTRQLNLEVIDNLFDQVRTKCGIASEPTSWQFMTTYRKFLISNLMKPRVRKTNTEDLTKWLIQIQTSRFKRPLNEHLMASQDPDDGEAERTFMVVTSDYKTQKLTKKHRLFEVSHHLLKKCAEKHECNFFTSYIKPYRNIPDFIEENRYRGYKGYSADQCKSLLVIPCDNFVQFVKRMDALFVPCFIMENFKPNIGKILYKNIINEPYNNPPCGCFPKQYLVKLFVRINMYNVIKFNNKAFSLSRSNAGKIIVSRL